MIIMKFGGTSVADAQAMMRVIHHIKTRHNKKTIVVVSAIAEATNILTHLAHLAANQDQQQYKELLMQLQQRHLKIATDLLQPQELLAQTHQKLNSYVAEVAMVLEKISLAAELTAHNFAKIVAYGELLSSTILHAALGAQQIETTLLDARRIIITDDNYQKGNPLLEHMVQIVPALLNKHLDQGYIILTQGFIAGTKEGTTTILGREGSDYSAALIGMVMDADEIQIWTDVDGIMTADPRKITNTKLIPFLSFREAAELSYFGAKVIHPLTIQPAATKNIPVRILNSMNLDLTQQGTLIHHEIPTQALTMSSITFKENIKIINVASNHQSPPHNFFQTIFLLLAQHQLPLDAATISGTTISLVLSQHEHLETVVNKLKPSAAVTIEEDQALIGIIGKNFNNTEKLINDIYQVLNDFNIRMIIYGASNHHLTLIIPKSHLISIMQKLHNAFFGEK